MVGWEGGKFIFFSEIFLLEKKKFWYFFFFGGMVGWGDEGGHGRLGGLGGSMVGWGIQGILSRSWHQNTIYHSS